MSSLPDEKRKSFHQKMLRRRITTILRPSHAAMVADVKHIAKRAKASPANDDCFDICGNGESALSPELRTEQLLLLALHPQSANPPLPPIPDQSSQNHSWAEPGWQLVLDDPDVNEGRRSSSILPVHTEGQLAQKFLSTCASSGRQAASLIKPRHLRMLEAPMSFACQASAPAETNPSGQHKAQKGVSILNRFIQTNLPARTNLVFIVGNHTKICLIPILCLKQTKKSASAIILSLGHRLKM